MRRVGGRGRAHDARLGLVVALAVAGCSTQTYHTRAYHLAAHEPSLAAGEAVEGLTDEGGTIAVRGDREVEVWLTGATTTTAGKERCVGWGRARACWISRSKATGSQDADTLATLRVDQLVAGCGRGDCPAKHVRDEPILVAKRTTVSGEEIARVVGALGFMGVGGYCAATCDGHVASYTVAAFTAATLLLVSPVLSLFK